MPRKPKPQPKSDEPDAFKLDLDDESIDPEEDDPPMEHLDRKRDTPRR
jgi:hypothetical protein